MGIDEQKIENTDSSRPGVARTGAGYSESSILWGKVCNGVQQNSL